MRFWFYTIRAMWRHMMGGWYVWSDTPTDVLIDVVALEGSLKPTDDGLLRSLIFRAVEELDLRLQSELRK